MLAHDVYQGFGMLETGSGQCLQAEFCNGQVHGWGIRFFANGTEAAGDQLGTTARMLGCQSNDENNP